METGFIIIFIMSCINFWQNRQLDKQVEKLYELEKKNAIDLAVLITKPEGNK